MFALVDSEAEVIDHKPKTILIGGEKFGEVEPGLTTDGRLRWHAVIRLKDRRMTVSYLAQGFAPSPQAAVIEAVRRGREESDAIAEKMAWLESELRHSKLEEPSLAAAL